MSGKKYGKGRQAGNQASLRQNEKVVEGPPVELENQFILRLPEEPASALREAIKSGASNLKERLFIQLEPDKGSNTQYLRKGHVQVSFVVVVMIGGEIFFIVCFITSVRQLELYLPPVRPAHHSRVSQNYRQQVFLQNCRHLPAPHLQGGGGFL